LYSFNFFKSDKNLSKFGFRISFEQNPRSSKKVLGIWGQGIKILSFTIHHVFRKRRYRTKHCIKLKSPINFNSIEGLKKIQVFFFTTLVNTFQIKGKGEKIPSPWTHCFCLVQVVQGTYSTK